MVFVVVLVGLAAAQGIYNLIRDAANDMSFSIVDPMDDVVYPPFGLEVVNGGAQGEDPSKRAA